jgi:hypothetical protein
MEATNTTRPEEVTEMDTHEILTGTLVKSYYPQKGKEGWVFAEGLGHKIRVAGPQVCIIQLDDGRKVWGITPLGLPLTRDGFDTTVRFSIGVEAIDWNAAGDFGFYVVRDPFNQFFATEVK